jgi:hypothetical protein
MHLSGKHGCFHTRKSLIGTTTTAAARRNPQSVRFPLLVNPRRIIMETMFARTDDNHNHMCGPMPTPHECSDSISTMLTRPLSRTDIVRVATQPISNERHTAKLRVGRNNASLSQLRVGRFRKLSHIPKPFSTEICQMSVH